MFRKGSFAVNPIVVVEEFKSMTCVTYGVEGEFQMKKNLISTCIISAILCLILTSSFGLVIADIPSNLEIINLSGNVFDFTYEQLLTMPKTIVNAELYCDGTLVTYGNWGGVLLSYLLTQAQVTPKVNSIRFEAIDEYQVLIPIDLANQPQIILAYEKDDQPLVEGLRLIIPDANGAAWIALIKSITMRTTGADYPQGVMAGVPKISELVPVEEFPIPESPSQQQDSIQTSPTISENSSSIQVKTPANVTQPYRSPTEHQLSNDILRLQDIILYLVAVASILLTVTVYMANRYKKIHASKNI
jgi:hypothetical protein